MHTDADIHPDMGWCQIAGTGREAEVAMGACRISLPVAPIVSEAQDVRSSAGSEDREKVVAVLRRQDKVRGKMDRGSRGSAWECRPGVWDRIGPQGCGVSFPSSVRSCGAGRGGPDLQGRVYAR